MRIIFFRFAIYAFCEVERNCVNRKETKRNSSNHDVKSYFSFVSRFTTRLRIVRKNRFYQPANISSCDIEFPLIKASISKRMPIVALNK